MKFAHALLGNHHWRLIYQSQVITSVDLRDRLAVACEKLQPLAPALANGGCLIAVGYGGLDYFFITLLASALGCRVVLCDPRLLSRVLQNRLDVVAIVSTRAQSVNEMPVVILEWQKTPQAQLPLAIADSEATLIFSTSGTTGTPKLVVYNETALCANARLVGDYLDIEPGDRVLCMFPIHYMYGFSTVMNSLLHGATVYVERPSLTVQEVLSYIVDMRVKFAPLIRSMIDGLCDLAERFRGIRLDGVVVLNASDRIYVQQVERLLLLGAVIWNNFGQTESGPRLFALKLTIDDLPRLADLCYDEVVAPGYPVDARIKVEILDANDQPCEPGKIGRMYYQTPFAMRGYLNSEGVLQAQSTIDSGDMVFRSNNGLVFWVGRKDETLKCNGTFVNISLLHRHFDQMPEVTQTYFTADLHTGALTAFLTPVPQTLRTDAELKQQVISEYRRSFPLYPRLAKVHFVDELPKTSTGKVNLSQLREHAKKIEEIQ